MKKFSFMIGAILTGLVSQASLAGPFSTGYVCVPQLKINDSPLEFSIRETSNCGEEEILMQVVRGPDGSTLLYPASEPLSPEVKSDLQKYKKYMGIQ